MEEKMSLEELQEIVSVCLDEICNLKQENENLKSQLKELTNHIYGIVDNQKAVTQKLGKVSHDVELNMRLLERGMDNLKYELNDPKLDQKELFFPRFYSIEATIDLIVKQRKSMARFGDGEFALMGNKARQKFQSQNDCLSGRLREIIKVNEDGFLIGIADNYGSVEQYTKQSKEEIRYYMTKEVREEHAGFLDENRVYHNAYISRPYAIFADNTTDAPKKRFENLKRIWDKRNIIFVEGSQTRLGVGNDLFDNAASVSRIVAPAVNSFNKYDEILDAALRFAKPDILFLIALGPTAGVLAYDLYRAGYQALDIGHLDLEYEWFLRGKGGRCEVKNKYNNEFPQGDIVEDIKDAQYARQILEEIN